VKAILAKHAIVTLAQASDFLTAMANSPDTCAVLEVEPETICEALAALPKNETSATAILPVQFVPGVPSNEAELVAQEGFDTPLKWIDQFRESTDE
jgi:hypothetical protein